MSCGPGTPTFRLLDGYVGWHPCAAHSDLDKLEGLSDPAGLRLRDPYNHRVPDAELSPHLPPPWLARGCGPCTWFVIGAGERPTLWQRDPCARWPSHEPLRSVVAAFARTRGQNTHENPRSGERGYESTAQQLMKRTSSPNGWIDLATRLTAFGDLLKPIALAAHGPWLAVADAAGALVFVWSIPDGRLVSRFPVKEPGALTFAPWGELLVVSAEYALHRFSVTGEPHGDADDALTRDAPIQRLGRGNDGAVYAALGEPDGPFAIARITLETSMPADNVARPCRETRTLAHEPDRTRWAKALPATGLIAVSQRGFCVLEPGEDGAVIRRCFTRDGASALPEAVEPPPPVVDKRKAKLETAWLDSGIPRCAWHRVRVDADVPADTSVTVEVASSETDPPAPSQPPLDWEELVMPDALLQKQPAGRYLRVRLTLTGSAATPIVRRVHLDFPRATSLDRLPPVYRDNPVAEDFSERFLSLFDASLDDMDEAVAGFARLMDSQHGPSESLAWLADLFGVRLDPSWHEQRIRAVLKALPRLYARRGTGAGLVDAIRLLFDLEPVIVEHADRRPWAAVGAAKLRSIRLFGASTARFRLGRSTLGATALTSYGNPDLDPFRSVAHRFTVLVPPFALGNPTDGARLDRLIAQQKPAHTLHTLRIGGAGFLLGVQSAVGIDTLFVPPTPAVLGNRHAPTQPGTAQLNRRTALYPGRRRRSHGLQVGAAIVGRSTVLE